MSGGVLQLSMDRATLQRLLALGTRRAYRKGAVIFAQGLPGDAMLCIETGRVVVEHLTEEGGRVMLGLLGAGDIAGEMAWLDEAPRSAGVVAATPVTGVLIGFDAAEAFFRQEPDALLAIMRGLSAKLRAANALSEVRAVDDGGARLARALLGLAERWGEGAPPGPVRLRETFSQGALGEIAGLARETVNRRLRDWTVRGWIAQEAGHLVVRNHAALLRAADPAD